MVMNMLCDSLLWIFTTKRVKYHSSHCGLITAKMQVVVLQTKTRALHVVILASLEPTRPQAQLQSCI